MDEDFCLALDEGLDLGLPLLGVGLAGDDGEDILGVAGAGEEIVEWGGVGDAGAALGSDDDGTAFFYDACGGAHALDGLVEVLIEGVAAVCGDDDVEEGVDGLHGGMADELDAELVSVDEVAGEDAGDGAAGVERYIEEEGGAGAQGDVAHFLPKGVAIGDAEGGVWVGDVGAAMIADDCLHAGDAGHDALWAAAESGEEVGLDEACDDADVGLDEMAIEQGGGAIGGDAELDEGVGIIGLVIEDAVIAEDGGGEHCLELLAGVWAMGAEGVEEGDAGRISAGGAKVGEEPGDEALIGGGAGDVCKDDADAGGGAVAGEDVAQRGGGGGRIEGGAEAGLFVREAGMIERVDDCGAGLGEIDAEEAIAVCEVDYHCGVTLERGTADRALILTEASRTGRWVDWHGRGFLSLDQGPAAAKPAASDQIELEKGRTAVKSARIRLNYERDERKIGALNNQPLEPMNDQTCRRFQFKTSIYSLAAAIALLPYNAARGETTLTPVIPAQRVSNIAIGGRNKSQDANPANFTLLDTRLFFTASDKNGNRGVYMKTLVNRDFVTLSPTSWAVRGNAPKLLKNFKLPLGVTDMDQFAATEQNGEPNTGKVYFHVPGSGLWMTYGKTPLVLGKFDNKTINEVTGLIPVQADLGENFGPKVYFGGWTKKTGQEVYRSAGTAKTTILVKDIVSGTAGSFPDEFKELRQGDASEIFFRTTPAGGANPQIWVTTTGTTGAIPVFTSTNGVPDQLVTTDDVEGTYFTLPATPGGIPDLWAVTNTPGSATQVTTGGVNPQDVTEFPANGDCVIFSGSDPVNGRQIWEASTLLGGGSTPAAEVLDVINPGGDANPHNLTAAGSEFYYAATVTDTNTQISSVLLFQTDGNPGDSLPIDYKPGAGGTYYPINPTEITPALSSEGAGDHVYFVADGYVYDGTGVNFHTGVLWTTVLNDGSTQDAVPVLDTNGNIVTGAHNLTAIVNDASPDFYRLYFARDGGDGFGDEVWVTEY